MSSLLNVNAQMLSYVRSLYEHPSKWYVSYQENGTKYLKSRKILDEQLQQQLNACAGEVSIHECVNFFFRKFKTYFCVIRYSYVAYRLIYRPRK